MSTVGPAEPGSIVTLPGHPTPDRGAAVGVAGLKVTPASWRQRLPLLFSHPVLLDFFGDPIDPLCQGSPVRGISQTRILE